MAGEMVTTDYRGMGRDMGAAVGQIPASTYEGYQRGAKITQEREKAALDLEKGKQELDEIMTNKKKFEEMKQAHLKEIPAYLQSIGVKQKDIDDVKQIIPLINKPESYMEFISRLDTVYKNQASLGADAPSISPWSVISDSWYKTYNDTMEKNKKATKVKAFYPEIETRLNKYTEESKAAKKEPDAQEALSKFKIEETNDPDYGSVITSEIKGRFMDRKDVQSQANKQTQLELQKAAFALREQKTKADIAHQKQQEKLDSLKHTDPKKAKTEYAKLRDNASRLKLQYMNLLNDPFKQSQMDDSTKQSLSDDIKDLEANESMYDSLSKSIEIPENLRGSGSAPAAAPVAPQTGKPRFEILN